MLKIFTVVPSEGNRVCFSLFPSVSYISTMNKYYYRTFFGPKKVPFLIHSKNM